MKPQTYSLDHRTPRSKGGANDLENCELACAEANTSKSDLTIEDYIQLCVEVARNNGYEVKKKEPESQS